MDFICMHTDIGTNLITSGPLLESDPIKKTKITTKSIRFIKMIAIKNVKCLLVEKKIPDTTDSIHF